jgi:hypothetical protein
VNVAAPGRDEVRLLVAARAGARLVERLDEGIAHAVGAVGVDAEGGDPERRAHRAPEAVGERDAVEVVEVNRAGR